MLRLDDPMHAPALLKIVGNRRSGGQGRTLEKSGLVINGHAERAADLESRQYRSGKCEDTHSLDKRKLGAADVNAFANLDERPFGDAPRAHMANHVVSHRSHPIAWHEKVSWFR